jgi:hypothetical protein
MSPSFTLPSGTASANSSTVFNPARGHYRYLITGIQLQACINTGRNICRNFRTIGLAVMLFSLSNFINITFDACFTSIKDNPLHVTDITFSIHNISSWMHMNIFTFSTLMSKRMISFLRCVLYKDTNTTNN